MPQAVAAVGNFLLTVFAGTSAAATAAAYIAANVLVYGTSQFLLNAAVASLQKRPKTGETRGMEATVTDSTADGRIIYGEVRTGGINVIPPITSGASGQYLHQVLALAIHEVDSITDVYFDQELISSASITAIANNSDDGKVTSGKYANAAWIRRRVGSSTQTTDYILSQAFPSTFTSDFRGRGIAYAALQYDWGNGKTYSGIPQVTFIIKGKKCYDPRLDTSPGANPTNPTYMAWTENPALCWADYKVSTYGRGIATSEIDWDSVVTAADICDATLSGATADPLGGTTKRYTCNGMLFANGDPNDNERKLIDSMMGRMSYVGGKYHVYAGAYNSTTFSIDKTDWVSISTIQTTASRDGGRWNGVKVYYVDPTRNWQRVECFPRFNDTYKSADAGERIWLEMEQPMCTSEYEAQRKGEFLLRASRNGIKISGILPPRYMGITPWATVALTFEELGWVSKIFRVVATIPNPNGSIAVSLVEEQSGDWADLATAEYDAPSTSTIPATNPTSPSAPLNFSVVPDFGVLKFDWDPPNVVPNGTRYRVIQSPGSASAVQSGNTIWDGIISDAIVRIAYPNSPYWYHVQAYVGSYYGPYTPNTFGIQCLPWMSPEGYRGNRVFPDGEFVAMTESYWSYNSGLGTTVVIREPGGRNYFRYTRTNSAADELFVYPKNPFPTVALANFNEIFFPAHPNMAYSIYLQARVNSYPGGAPLTMYIRTNALEILGVSSISGSAPVNVHQFNMDTTLGTLQAFMVTGTLSTSGGLNAVQAIFFEGDSSVGSQWPVGTQVDIFRFQMTQV